MKRPKKSIDNILDDIKGINGSLRFHNSTKYSSYENYKKVSSKLWPESWKKIYFKAYPRLKQIILPNPEIIQRDLIETILNRISRRNFSGKAIDINELSNLIYYSAGIKFYNPGNPDSSKRTYPSAGARYPLEIYPIALNINGLDKGIYHYHLKTHSLEVLYTKPFLSKLSKQFNQNWILKSSLIILITAVFNRTEIKYKDRGYRHILTECGHVSQNFYLLSSALGLGCCSVGGYVDDGLNELLDINGFDESVIGVIAIGPTK